MHDLRLAFRALRATPVATAAAALSLALGIGANLNKWAPQDFALATRMIATYKRIRPTVQLGNLYRLASPRTNDVTVNQYVAADGKQSVVFAFRHSQQYNTPAPTIYLRGLDEKATYKLEGVDNKLMEKQPALSGAYLMNRGLNVNLRGDFDSTAVILEKQ